MRIDGKTITRLNQNSAVSKTNKASNQKTEQSDVSLDQASQYALNQSDIDQKTRLANDKVNVLQSRQKALENSVDRLSMLGSANHGEQDVSNIAEDIKHSGLFDGTPFAHSLDNLLTKEASFEPLQKAINDELGSINSQLSQQVEDNRVDPRNFENLLNNLQKQLKDNSQALNLAHSRPRPELVDGLLGNNAG
jgi:hypothetical protein